MRTGQRVRITAGPRRGEEGIVALSIRAGADVELDGGETTYQLVGDLEAVVTL